MPKPLPPTAESYEADLAAQVKQMDGVIATLKQIEKTNGRSAELEEQIRQYRAGQEYLKTQMTRYKRNERAE